MVRQALGRHALDGAQHLLTISQSPIRPPVEASGRPTGRSTCSSRSDPASGRRTCVVFAGADLRREAVRLAGAHPRDCGIRHLLRAVGRRVSRQRHRRPRERPTASAQGHRPIAVRRAASPDCRSSGRGVLGTPRSRRRSPSVVDSGSSPQPICCSWPSTPGL